MKDRSWRCSHSPACCDVGVRCEKPDTYEFRYQIGYVTEGETDPDKIREGAAHVAMNAYDDGFREGWAQALLSLVQ